MAENGSNRKLYLVKNDSTTYVVGQTSSNLSLNDELLASSDKMDQWERYISGQKSWSASVTLNLSNNANDKQVEFIKSLVAGTPVDIFLGELKENVQSDGVTLAVHSVVRLLPPRASTSKACTVASGSSYSSRTSAWSFSAMSLIRSR